MTIQINKVAAQRGLVWISRSWQLFKEQSGLWMQAMFFIIASSLGAQMLGAISPIFVIIYAFVHPFLMSGMYHMAFKAKNGINSEFSDLFIAFKDVKIRRVMLQIASVSLLVSLLVTFVGADNLAALQDQQSLDPGSALLFVIISAIYLMFFFYAIPIAYFFHEQNLLLILKTSFKACWQNIVPLIVFALVAMTLCLLTLPTMLLGLFIVLPWLTIAFYISFDDVLGGDFPPDDGDLCTDNLKNINQQNKKDDATFIV